jgi:hypothetical protein
MSPGAYLAAVLDLAAFGVAVLPLWPAAPGGGCSCSRGVACDSPGKHPAAFLTPSGLKDATRDPETLRRWWASPERRTGRSWNVGAVVPPWLAAVDMDGPEGLAALHAEGLSLPATLTAETGRPGGLHCWYRTERPIPPAVGVLAHVDVRGPGSYLVAPPSLHASGRRYQWRAGSFDPELIAPAPSWLHELARPAAAPSIPTDPDRWGELLAGPVVEGARNATAARVAGLCFRCLPAAAAWPLLEAWNATACKPPLRDDELGRVAASIAARELARRGGAR